MSIHVKDLTNSERVSVEKMLVILKRAIVQALYDQGIECTPANTAAMHEALVLFMVEQTERIHLPLPILLSTIAAKWASAGYLITDEEHDVIEPVSDLAGEYADAGAESGCLNPHCPIHPRGVEKPS